MADYLLPDVGEGLTEAEIVAWHVKVGDVVEVNQVIVEIETAKSVVELPSPFAGTVQAILAEVGETLPVGEPIISIGDATESSEPPATSRDTAGAGAVEALAGAPAAAAADRAPMDAIDLSNPAASGGSAGESLVGRVKADRGPVRRPRRGSASPSTLAGAATQMQVQGAFAPGGAMSGEVVTADEPPVPAEEPAGPVAPERPLAKPSVRGLARELGVDLAEVTATGEDGTVTRDDVLAASGTSSSSRVGGHGGDDVREEQPGTSSSWGVRGHVVDDVRGVQGAGPRERRVPVKGLGKAMAEAMTASAFSAPHVTEWLTVDCTATVRLVERIRQRREFSGLRITPMLVLARACILAMRRTPEVNSVFDAEAGEVVLRDHVNLGIAAATPRGLVVPNVKDADQLDLLGLAQGIRSLVDAARSGRPRPADLAGGTFTITNVGVFGVDAGTPIINPGESAILAFGAVNKRPWVDEETGEIVVRDVTTLALSFDHRHVDGRLGSQFLADVGGVLRDPGSALLL